LAELKLWKKLFFWLSSEGIQHKVVIFANFSSFKQLNARKKAKATSLKEAAHT
jgi:hypothetical protein